MLFPKRLERSFKLSRERREQREQAAGKADDETMKRELEKGDLFAMILSGIGVILPVAVLVLLGLCAAGYFFLFR